MAGLDFLFLHRLNLDFLLSTFYELEALSYPAGADIVVVVVVVIVVDLSVLSSPNQSYRSI